MNNEIIEMDNNTNNNNNQQHPWERGHDRPWEQLSEDVQGYLHQTSTNNSEINQNNRMKRKNNRSNTTGIIRGMLRAVIICIDVSQSCLIKDLKPSRLVVMVDEICEFILRFHDENPLSTLGVICTGNGKALRLVDISRNPTQTIQILRRKLLFSIHDTQHDFIRDVPSNLPSIKNALILSKSMLDSSPTYTSKEVIMVCSATSILDPGDVFVTMDKMKDADIKCSSIHVMCYMEVYKRLTETTRGKFGVSKDKLHLRELLSEHLSPPPISSNQRKYGRYVKMGFPSQMLPDSNKSTPSFCLSEEQIIMVPYFCPNCLCPTSYLPSTCRVCQLPLIASSHLARTYHHLYPVERFFGGGGGSQQPQSNNNSKLNKEEENSLLELEIDNTTNKVSESQKNQVELYCFGCGMKNNENFSTKQLQQQQQGIINQCGKCLNWFCDVCDELIHESLFACPGDLLLLST
jgi:transcription initiation factor TFIIH subunit 2